MYMLYAETKLDSVQIQNKPVVKHEMCCHLPHLRMSVGKRLTYLTSESLRKGREIKKKQQH